MSINYNTVRYKIGELNSEKFELLANSLMRIEYGSYGILEANQSYRNKIQKYQPDGHILHNSKYIAFNYTTVESRNIKDKITRDIINLNNEKCRIAGKISKVVICTNTPLNELREYYSEIASQCGFQFEIYGLDTLTYTLIKYPKILYEFFQIESKIESKHYNCGDRIKEIREGLGLSQSQFIDSICINSEKELEKIESKTKECSEIDIIEIGNKTGINTDWIKFGNTKKYSIYKLRDIGFNKNLSDNTYLKIHSVYYCIEPIEMELCIIIKYSDYYIKAVGFNHNLKFWEWFGDESRTIRSFFKELYDFSKKTHCQEYGRIIDKQNFATLMSGNFNYSDIAKIIIKPNSYWLEDLFLTDFDLKHKIDRVIPLHIQDWYWKLNGYYVNYFLNIQ